MGKEEVAAAIAALEATSRTVDNWVLICAAGVAICLAVEVVFSVAHWRNENRLRPLREAQSRIHETELAELRGSSARFAKEAEELRQKNLAVEEAVSPRTLEQNLTAQRLRAFGGLSFVVLSPPDFEPRRTAGQIRFMLRQAGWARSDMKLEERYIAFHDGVTVHGIAGPNASRAGPAIDALVGILNENGIETRRGFPIMPLGPTTIAVVVGPKPLPKSLQVDPVNVPADARNNRVYGNTDE